MAGNLIGSRSIVQMALMPMNDKDHDQPDWRQARYQRFYEVVDHIVPEILALQEDGGRENELIGLWLRINVEDFARRG